MNTQMVVPRRIAVEMTVKEFEDLVGCPIDSLKQETLTPNGIVVTITIPPQEGRWISYNPPPTYAAFCTDEPNRIKVYLEV